MLAAFSVPKTMFVPVPLGTFQHPSPVGQQVTSLSVSLARQVEQCVSAHWLYLTCWALCPEDGGE